MQRRPTQEEVNKCLSVLRDEAKKHQVNAQRLAYLEKLAKAESGGCQIGADGSNAFGMFQFTPKTWDKYADKFGLDRTNSKNGDGRNDIRQQVIAAIKSTEDNELIFKRRFKRAPDDGELYLMHFAGETPALNAISLASKGEYNTPVQNVLSEDAIKSNSGNGDPSNGVRINFNGGGYLPIKDFKVGDFINWSNGKMDIPAKYQTNSLPQYEKNKFGIPESMGNWVAIPIIAIAIAAVVAIGNIIFGDDDDIKAPQSTPRRTPPRSRA